jgi:hypothetical protein
MSIKVSCKCGQTFTAKDELVGQTLLCPKCHQPLTIGEAKEKKTRAAAGEISSLFDEAGIKEVKGARCPQCGSGLPPGGVLCVQCGFNHETGETIQGAKILKEGEDGRADAADSTMAFAEKEIETTKRELKLEMSQGTPAWILFLQLAILCGFTLTMYLMPRDQAVLITGICIAAFGALLMLIAMIRIVIVAFKERLLHGFLCLFIPPYGLYYVISRWSRCKKLFGTIVGALLIAAAGAGLAAISPTFKPKEVRLPIGRSRAVIVAAVQMQPSAAVRFVPKQ